MIDESQTRERIEELVAEEHRLLSRRSSEGLDSERHERLEAIRVELDSLWDLLRRRQAGQTERLADSDVPDPPNDLDGPEPEPRHLEHGVHAEGAEPGPDINPNVP